MDTAALPDELAVSIITIATLTAALQLDPVPVDEPVVAEWARLRVLLRDSGQRMSVNDSWIAATAMALEVPVVTQDDDFPEIEGLDVSRL